MDESDLRRARMHRHRLWGGSFAGPAEVVRAFGAMQAQEFLPAKWALAQRSSAPDGTPVDEATVEARFAEGTILRTHVLRPTWHFVHRDDLRWLLVVSAPRVHQVNAHYYRLTGVEGATVGRSQDVLRRELTGGEQRTRKELAAALAVVGLPSTGVPLAYLLMRAELDGVIVSGGRRGRAHTYALFDDRVPPGDEPDPEVALAELTRRYLTVRGPASLKDFMAWASLRTKQAQRGIDLLGHEVERTTLGDVVLFETGGDPAGEIAAARDEVDTAVDLIQGYDEYVMGYSQTRVAPLSIRPGGGAPDFLHTILLDGGLAGRWKQVITSTSVTVAAQLHVAPTPAQESALDDAVRRYGRFHGLPTTRT